MRRQRPFDEVHAELADEHRQIMQLVERIEAPQPGDVLSVQLKTLHDLLVNHFAHEQFPGGLYECMGINDDSHHEELKVLVREHCEILSSARALVERSRDGDIGGDAGAALHDDVAGLLQALHAHETREHRLAQVVRRETMAAG